MAVLGMSAGCSEGLILEAAGLFVQFIVSNTLIANTYRSGAASLGVRGAHAWVKQRPYRPALCRPGPGLLITSAYSAVRFAVPKASKTLAAVRNSKDTFGEFVQCAAVYDDSQCAMYLFAPHPEDRACRGTAPYAAAWDSSLIVIEGAAAENKIANPVENDPLIVKAREYLDCARRLAAELAGAPSKARQRSKAFASAVAKVETSLQDCESAVSQIQNAMVRLNQLQQAASCFAGGGPRALRMFGHVVRRQEACLREACRSTFTALGTLGEDVTELEQHCRPSPGVGEEANRTIPSSRGKASATGLWQLIAALKGLVTIIMAALMAPDRRMGWVPTSASAPGSGSQDHSGVRVEAAAERDRSTACVDPEASAALLEVKAQCQERLAKLRDAEGDKVQGNDPDFRADGEGPEAAAEKRILSFFALFELLTLILDKPPKGHVTQWEARMLTMTEPLPTRMTALKEVLKNTIGRYPSGERTALQELYKLAFEPSSAPPALDVKEPRHSSAAAAVPIPNAVEVSAGPASVATPAASPMPMIRATPLPQWGTWIAALLLCAVMNLLIRASGGESMR